MSEEVASGVSPTSPPGKPWTHGLFRSLILWLVLFATLLTVYNHTYHLTNELFVQQLQIIPAMWILELTLPGQALRYTADSILTTGLEVQVLRGCDGVEAWLMLATAMLVFPMSWKHRVQGLALGSLLVYLVNITRISSLFHIALKKPAWLEIAHGVVWQSAIVLMAALFVLMWLDPSRVSKAVKGTAA